MRVSLVQILILLIITFLLFGDVSSFKKKIKKFLRKTAIFSGVDGTKKKGI